jgi:hypothetical protein
VKRTADGQAAVLEKPGSYVQMPLARARRVSERTACCARNEERRDEHRGAYALLTQLATTQQKERKRAANDDAPVSGCILRTSMNSAPAASVSTGSDTTRPSGMVSVAHGASSCGMMMMLRRAM